MIVKSRVATAASRQYVSGEIAPANPFMPEESYTHALDSLVVVCVDCMPLLAGKVLLSRRTRAPLRSWWINGGRMIKGELYAQAAARIMSREIGLDLDPSRFALLGYYGLIWDERAQTPSAHGCHTLSVTHTVELDDREAAQITLNDEYDDMQWVAAKTVIGGADAYHPALIQMFRDLDARSNEAGSPAVGWSVE